jgi:hypothetical protein
MGTYRLIAKLGAALKKPEVEHHEKHLAYIFFMMFDLYRINFDHF